MFAKVLVANTRLQVELPITIPVFRIDPVDPRPRFVTTKYNPARTWTPENAVASAARTCASTGWRGRGGISCLAAPFRSGTPRSGARYFRATRGCLTALTRRFFAVTLAELTEARAAFPHGDGPLRIDETRFRRADEQRAHRAEVGETGAFKARQQAAFEAERVRWQVARRTLRVGEILAVVETD